MSMMFQCELRCSEGLITMSMVSWIHERGAKEGATVKLKGFDDWWTVTKVYQPGMTEEQLLKQQEATRKSLPSIDYGDKK